MMSDREIKDAIRERANLVEIVGRNVKLRRAGGSEWVGCCPFHGERTPSFYVIPQKSMWHCFGCGEHGDAFDYLMRQEGLTFPEAMEQLAGLTGVELPKRERRDVEADQKVDRLRAILEEAQAFFAAQVVSEEDALCYLQGRGLTSAFVERAGLGVAPPTWDMLVKHLRAQGYKDADIEAAGVAAQGQKGGLIDAMRNRITIPIRDYRGKLVGFGGRIMGDEKPKYLNTRETALFNKGEILFGLDVAKGHFQDGALVVEGYFDVLTLQHLGLPVAVAPLGTALTTAHLDRLKKYTNRITLCFDGDEAGHRAMEKSLALALPKGFDVRLLELPSGHDPDTWAMSVGGEAFRALMQKAPDWTAFKIARAVNKRDMRKTPERMEALKELAPMLCYVPAESQDAYVGSLAHQLQVPASEVRRASGMAQEPAQEAPGASKAPAPAPSPRPGATRALDNALKALLVAMLSPATRERALASPRSWWNDLSGADLIEDYLDNSEQEWGPDTSRAVNEACARISMGYDPGIDLLLGHLEGRFVDSQIKQTRSDLEAPTTPPDMIEALELEMAKLIERRSMLHRRRSA